MGVCFVWVCETCKKRVDLNKNKAVAQLWYDGVRTEHKHDIQESFLFLRKHWGHQVELDNDATDDYGFHFGYEEEQY